jgi:D-3-phosphoglycerate dehydrogenase
VDAAALDVFEQEPYRGPLLGCENVVLTSHVGSLAREARQRMEVEAAENLLLGLDKAGVLQKERIAND